MSATDYRFVWSAKWLAGHVLAIVGIAVFVTAGFWQLSRLEERRTENRLIELRAMGPALGLPTATTVAADPGAYEWLRVTVTGRWSTADEVILRAQSLDGVSGHDVLTPLVVDDTVIVVNRGWVPIDVGDPPVVAAAPVSDTVTVTGVLRSTQVRGSFGPVDPPDGTLDEVARVDIARLDAQIAADLYPMWLQLLEQVPEQPGLPARRALPELGEGPHLSYAVQWFAFAAVVAIGYPILLWRTAGGTLGRRRS